MWQPIETAPKDNKRPLWLARFNDDGTMQSFDYNGSWEKESESWEMPEVYYFWASENGNAEEPSHWAYQPEGFYALPGAKALLRVPDTVMAALDSLDDYIARIEGNDRGACNHINLLRRYLLDATDVGENK